MCALAHLLAIRLDAGCLTAFRTKCGPPLQMEGLRNWCAFWWRLEPGLLDAGNTSPRDGAEDPPNRMMRCSDALAMELWWCTTRVVQGVRDHNTEAGPDSSCDWGSGWDPQ